MMATMAVVVAATTRWRPRQQGGGDGGMTSGGGCDENCGSDGDGRSGAGDRVVMWMIVMVDP